MDNRVRCFELANEQPGAPFGICALRNAFIDPVASVGMLRIVKIETTRIGATIAVYGYPVPYETRAYKMQAVGLTEIAELLKLMMPILIWLFSMAKACNVRFALRDVAPTIPIGAYPATVGTVSMNHVCVFAAAVPCANVNHCDITNSFTDYYCTAVVIWPSIQMYILYLLPFMQVASIATATWLFADCTKFAFASDLLKP